MLKRRAALIAFIMIIMTALMAFSACTPPLPRKEEFGTVLLNYENTNNKRAKGSMNVSFDASFNLNMEKYDGKYSLRFLQIGEMDKIASDGRVVADFDIYTGGNDKLDSDLSLLTLALKGKGLDDLANIVGDYFNKKSTMASLLIGFDGDDTYNLKSGYYGRDEEREYQNFYAIDQNTINLYQEELGIYEDDRVSLADEFMACDFFNIISSPALMGTDNAPARLNEKDNTFLYSFPLNNSLLKEQIMLVFEQKLLPYLAMFGENNIMDDYEKIKPSMQGWFNIQSTSVKAVANASSELLSMETALKLEVSVPNKDLKNVVNIILPGRGEEVVNWISDIKINIDFSITEVYSYDSVATNLDKYVAQNIFQSSDKNIADRKVLCYEDFVSLTTE